jgi:hypothetical protein
LPQVPQFDESVLVFLHTPPQQLCVPGHSPGVVPQVHFPPPQLSPGEQVVPHPPQFWGSVAVFWQMPLQLVRPAWQKLQTPFTQ